MFQPDTRIFQRSGASISSGYQFSNRTAASSRHSNMEIVNGLYNGTGRDRQRRTPISGGFPWQTPYKELDPTVVVLTGTAVYISPNNPLVLTGLVDLVSNALTLSRPGTWLSVQNIPVKNGSNKYNVPAVPYPSMGGSVTGSPLTGDADSANLYWMLLSEMPYC